MRLAQLTLKGNKPIFTNNGDTNEGLRMNPNKTNKIGNRMIMAGVCLIILGLIILSPILVFVWLAQG
jgi:hypothetical protein